ncbi:matrixin family metalloprotease [Candidatus Pacearchaeota archaeon]|nr:matrixin family metalloprotease [Candidatus Pacearchaeota archaeon]MBD3283596.1 matrixin family metalloprotease [Candidatus Pacearchaeota archaeon]
MKEEIPEKTGTRIFITVLQTLVFIILIFLILVMLYLLYYNLPGVPEDINPVVDPLKTKNITYSEVGQFFPNMKFNHNKITYKIDENCDKDKEKRMLEAFNMLTEKVPQIIFLPINQNPDIEISCTRTDRVLIERSDKIDYFVAGEGGAREVIPTGKYNVIVSGIILLYGEKKHTADCDWPNVELHELMHVFGFNHSKNENSLMYPYLESCDQKLDDSIIRDLKKLYSEENLPDLYFEKVDAIKKGRYLDFNITVKNAGTVDAKDATFSIIDSGSLIETKQLRDLKFGAGIFLEVRNMKLKNRYPDELKFILDYNGKIKELDEENNEAKVTF